MAWDETYGFESNAVGEQLEEASAGTLFGTSLSSMGMMLTYEVDATNGGLFSNWQGASNYKILWRNNGTLPGLTFAPNSGTYVCNLATGTGDVAGDVIRTAWRWTNKEIKVFWHNVSTDTWATPTTASTPGKTWGGSADKFYFGDGPSVSQSYSNGRLKHIAVWDGDWIPSDDFYESLCRGYVHPLSARPTHYWPCTQTSGSSVIDMVGSDDLTVAAGTFEQDTTSYRRPPRLHSAIIAARESAAPAGSIARQHYHHRHHNLAG